jgi:hypothetical protein
VERKRCLPERAIGCAARNLFKIGVGFREDEAHFRQANKANNNERATGAPGRNP